MQSIYNTYNSRGHCTVIVLLLVLLEGQEVYNHKAGIQDKYRLLLNTIKGTVQRDLTQVTSNINRQFFLSGCPAESFFQILFSCPFVRYIKPFSVTSTKKVAFFCLVGTQQISFSAGGQWLKLCFYRQLACMQSINIPKSNAAKNLSIFVVRLMNFR